MFLCWLWNLTLVSVKDWHPLPQISKTSDALKGILYFLTLDFCSGYRIWSHWFCQLWWLSHPDSDWIFFLFFPPKFIFESLEVCNPPNKNVIFCVQNVNSVTFKNKNLSVKTISPWLKNCTNSWCFSIGWHF